ncbi:HAD family acid phosphatase, partial [Salmonella enterica subsp. enterica serovar Paratyphi A]
ENMDIFLFCFLASVLATSQAATTPHQIHLLRPQSGSSGHHVHGISCLSWRLAVEVDNIRDWDLVPAACENYVGHYMLGHQYRKDCNAAMYVALQYAKSLKLTGDGKDIWVFDIDETTLSNLPYYARPENGFGAKEYNSTSFNEWIEEGRAPPVPAVLKLYQKLLSLGFKTVIISGTSEKYINVRISNLKLAGYH